MDDILNYLRRQVIVVCRTAEQVDELCSMITMDKPSQNSIKHFHKRLEIDAGGVGLRLFVNGAESIEYMGYSNASFYRHQPEYRGMLVEFDDLFDRQPEDTEAFQAPEIPF